MFDHVGLNVRDYDASKRFYDKALAALGYGVVMEFDGACGYGPASKPEFWIAQREPVGTGAHVAFAGDRATVDAFYEAAVAAGGKDNGPPGVRADYHEHYYAAFVHDPDGNNVEVVCHTPEDT